MKLNKAKLNKLWFSVWHRPGWLRILELIGVCDQEDIRIPEQIDEEAIAYEQEAEKEYQRRILPEARQQEQKFIREIKDEYGEDLIKGRRLEFLDNKIEELNKAIDKIWKEEEEAVGKDVPYWLRKASIEIKNPELVVRKRKSLLIEILLLEHPQKELPGRVSGVEIARALEFPFSQLIQLNKVGFALCPKHKESRPSFYVKNNWGYCFGCGYQADTIKFLMDKEGLTFPQAVHMLQ